MTSAQRPGKKVESGSNAKKMTVATENKLVEIILSNIYRQSLQVCRHSHWALRFSRSQLQEHALDGQADHE